MKARYLVGIRTALAILVVGGFSNWHPAMGQSLFEVKIWADTSGVEVPTPVIPIKPPPSDGDGAAAVAIGLSGSNHTIAFGPGNKNLFLVQDGEVFSSTGPVGGVPGTFTDLGALPKTGSNEGSAFFSAGNTLYVGNESDEELYGVPVTGMGSSVAIGSATTYDGETGAEGLDTGETGEFDEVEGVALLNGTPVFNDANSTPMFATSFGGVPIMVNGTNFPIVDANWSGKTILLADEDDDNLMAAMVLNDGTVSPIPAVALVETNGTPFSDVGDADSVAVTPDGKYAYVHDEDDGQFFRFDLLHIDATGGSSHVKEFDFTAFNFPDDALTVLNGYLYTVASGNGANVLVQIPIDPATGDLLLPRAIQPITDGQGHSASGSTRMTNDGICLYISDSAADRIFQLCAGRSLAPAMGSNGLAVCAGLLLMVGVIALRRNGLLGR